MQGSEQVGFEEMLIMNLKRSSRLGIIVGLGIMIFFSFIIVAVQYDKASPTWTLWGGGILSAFFVLLGGLIVWVGIKNSPNRSRILQALRESPDQVVWIFHSPIVYNGRETNLANLTFGFSDGKTQVLSNLKLDQLEHFMPELQKRLPRARFGYSKELQKQFKSNPAGMTRL